MPSKELTLTTVFKGHMDETFRKATTRLKTILAGLNKTLLQTSSGFNKFSKAADGVGKKSKKAADGTNKLNSAMTVGQAASGKYGSALARVSTAMKIIASFGFAGSIIFALTNAMKTGVGEIIEFDQALRNLQAITNATSSEMASMEEAIKDVARVTKFSTAEVADALTVIGQAGFSAAEAVQTINAVAILATGTLTDIRTVTDLMTTSIRAFNLEAIESARVADIMANAVNKSKLTIDKLRIAFNFVGAISSQVGLSLEEVAASLMVLANNGIRASTMGTGLRQVLSRLVAPNKKLKEAFIENGISLDKINPSTIGWTKALKNLSAVLFDTEKGAVDTSKAFSLFGLRGAQSAAIIVKSFMAGDYERALELVFRVGTAEAMAAEQAEGLGLKFKNLADRAKLLAIAFGDAGVGGILHTFVDVLKSVVTAIENMVKSIEGKLLIQLALWTTSTWALIKASSLLIGVLNSFLLIPLAARLGAAAFSFGILGKSVVGVTNKFRLFIAAFSPGILFLFIAVLGSIVILFDNILLSADQTVKSIEKLAEESQTSTSSLSAYVGALTNLNERLNANEDISLEYIALLQRLIKAHPDLVDEIDLTTLAYKENLEIVEKFLGEQQQKNLENMVKLVREYGNASEEAAIKAGFWKFVQKNVLELVTSYRLLTSLLDDLGEVHVTVRNKILPVMKAWTKEIGIFFKVYGEGTKKVIKFDKDRSVMLRKITVDYAESIKQGKLNIDDLLATLKLRGGLLGFEIKGVVDGVSEIINRSTKEVEKTSINMVQTVSRAVLLIEKELIGFEAVLDKLNKTQGELDFKKIEAITNNIFVLRQELVKLKFRQNVVNLKGLKAETAGRKLTNDLIKLELERQAAVLDLRIRTEKREEKIAELKRKQIDLQRQINDLESDAPLLERRLRDYGEANTLLVKLKNKVGEYNKETVTGGNSIKKNLADQITLLKEIDKLRLEIIDASIVNNEDVVRASAALTQAKADLVEAAEKKETTEEIEKRQRTVIRLNNDLLKIKRGILQSIIDNNGVLKIGEHTIELTSEQLQKVKDKITAINDALVTSSNKLKTNLDIITETARNLGASLLENLSSGLADMVTASGHAKVSFKEMADSIINDIVRIIAKLVIAQALWAAFGGTTKGKEILTQAGIANAGIGIGDLFGGGGGSKLALAGGVNTLSRVNVQDSFARRGQQDGTGTGDIIIMNINATDAQSFAKMLASKPAQEMVGKVVVDKFTHNAPIRRALRKK